MDKKTILFNQEYIDQKSNIQGNDAALKLSVALVNCQIQFNQAKFNCILISFSNTNVLPFLQCKILKSLFPI